MRPLVNNANSNQDQVSISPTFYEQFLRSYSLLTVWLYNILAKYIIGVKAVHKMLVKLTTDHHHCLSNSCCDRG